MTSTNPKDHIRKFQKLLRELFQFDCAELDFGIYRIMNHKRDVLEQFINETLPNLVDTDLEQGILFQQNQANKALDESREEVIKWLGPDAIDSDGKLIEETLRNTQVGKTYLDAQAAAASGRSRPAVEIDIYNHLYAFFSRYYQEGDFISKRRYSRNQRYAIPYNGEEVYLHWANSDQYYIKTAEYFHNYDWKAPNGMAVHFRLKAADVEQDNVKGEKRFFLPLITETKWDDNTREVTIPFEYRPLTLEESNEYKKTNQQEKIITAVIDAIREQLGNAPEALTALMDDKPQNSDRESITFLEYHLRQYTKRNTSDFFIHKDLKGFLTRELDFYLKNEVLNLDEMAATSEDRLKGWFQMMQLIKSVGSHIIDFLDQIEGFQKMLWEKRKFITETQYCITVGNIDESFYADIAGCEAQWTEWKALFGIDDDEADLFNLGKNKHDKRIAFLKTRPTLVLDTKHFDRNFIDRLLASFDKLDEMTDGLLIHSENYQALNLLQEGYREQVKCIYIDPPYNTGLENDFIFKDNYKHSSWMSMMLDRLKICREVASPFAGIFVSTDDGEYANLKFVLSQSWGTDNFIADVIWNSRKSVSSDTLISDATNHTTFFAANKKILDSNKANFRLPQLGENFSNPNNDPLGPWTLDPMDAPNIRENLTYEIVNPLTGKKFLPPTGRCWRFEKEETENLLSVGRIVFGYTGTARPMYKRYLSEAHMRGKTPTTLWNDVKTTTDATKLLLSLFGTTLPRTLINKIKPKPNEMIERCTVLLTDWKGIVLDYFAGSGTTGHAVINLNRKDDGRRKFILVEMGEYFDTVLLPRIKKITFTPEWKGGKPKRMATPEEAQQSPHIIKYIRLESYEDALNNIEFDDTTEQLKLEEKIDDYLLKYMLKWETKHSQTLLNVEKLTSPFIYQLQIHVNGEIQERIADIPETFNYLLGLNVSTRKVYVDDGRRYLVYRGKTREAPGREIAVIWRETKGWTPSDFERDRQFVAEQKLIQDVDVVYINGDSSILNAKAIEPVFKARMFA